MMEGSFDRSQALDKSVAGSGGFLNWLSGGNEGSF
jgi:hypothetical protein